MLVIHPGSRFIRIGRASDVSPVSTPNVIARKNAAPVPSPIHVETISRPRRGGRSRFNSEDVSSASDDPVSSLSCMYDILSICIILQFEEQLAQLTHSLRDRMKFYKLRVTPNAFNVTTSFNEAFEPEIIPEHNDPNHVDWITTSTKDVLVGEPAMQLADPLQSGYVVRWPIYGATFNTRDYSSIHITLGDIEEIIRTVLREELSIPPSEYKVRDCLLVNCYLPTIFMKNFSVVLVIPDLYDRSYVRHLVHMLLITMGFKQLCAQQVPYPVMVNHCPDVPFRNLLLRRTALVSLMRV